MPELCYPTLCFFRFFMFWGSFKQYVLFEVVPSRVFIMGLVSNGVSIKSGAAGAAAYRVSRLLPLQRRHAVAALCGALFASFVSFI